MQTITETADRGNEAESSKIVLNLVMQKGALAQRTMWESFAIMRNAVPKLDRILKEVEEHGTVSLHCKFKFNVKSAPLLV